MHYSDICECEYKIKNGNAYLFTILIIYYYGIYLEISACINK